VAHAYKNERDFLDYEFARAKVIEWGESAYACEFRRNPAGDSDLMSAAVPI
jgi:hypothetical protein